MSKPNFYNDNRFRAFPFIAGTTGVSTPDAGPLILTQLPDQWLVDAGFQFGSESQFDAETDKVYLQRIIRTGSTIFWVFRATTAALQSEPLIFESDLSDELHQIQFSESGSAKDSVSGSVDDACREPLWHGYLVTGDLSQFADYVEDGEIIENEGTEAEIEPGLLINCANTFVTSFEIANADRTRVTAPEGCDNPVWPFETGLIYEQARCVQGDVRLQAGYNCVITQDVLRNALVIGAEVGSGEGEPCSEVALFEDEVPPNDGSSLLTGGVYCNETFRSINGLGGPLLTFLGKTGVVIEPDPANHRLVINVNLVNMLLCGNDSES